MQLIKTYFPEENKLKKILSRNTLKLSYSCTPNIKTKIHENDKEILWIIPSKNTNHCNCQQRENCPMNGACLKQSLVYYATASCNHKNYNRNYKKEAAKQVLRSAIVTTKHLTYHFQTRYQASNGILELNKNQLNPRIFWRIKGIFRCYNSTSKRCNLYLTEKLSKLDDPDKKLVQ